MNHLVIGIQLKSQLQLFGPLKLELMGSTPVSQLLMGLERMWYFPATGDVFLDQRGARLH